MGKRRDIHLQRLHESLEAIQSLQGGTTYDEEFSLWKDRTKRSLEVLFGEDHQYTQDFRGLNFQLLVVGGPRWSTSDQQEYDKGMRRAEILLSDAIEEIEAAPDAFPERRQTESSVPSDASTTVQLIVKQNQSVQQIQTVSFDQIVGSIDQLGLPEGDADRARELAEDFQAEAEGQGRWSRLGEVLESLKGLGQTVWSRVGIPLLLEWIKHETGMSGTA